MRRWPLILVALAITLGALLAASPTTAPSVLRPVESKAVEKDGLIITVLIEQRAISADEQPRFLVRFKNTSGDYINLYDIDAFWNWQIRLTNTDNRAVDAGPWRLRFATISYGGHPIAHKQVRPGESTEVVINLNDPPFTFDYEYEGTAKHLVTPVRFLSPGTYRIKARIALQNPFGPGHHEWTGPVSTETVEFTISKTGKHETPPTEEEVAAYDDAINRVTDRLEPGGLWLNGGFPDIKLPADANAQDVVASAVNTHRLGSKAYRILRVRRIDRPTGGISAALVKVGATTKVLIFFPDGKDGWWTRFYDTELLLPATKPSNSSPK